MSIVRLFKFLKLNPVYFHKNSVLIPNEIKIDIPCIIPPVVFAHFLCSLCYYHLKDNRQCQNSLEDLKLTIDENYFIAQFVEKANSHTLLGVISQTIGDMDSARHAFMQSIKLFPDPENNAYHRLELLNWMKLIINYSEWSFTVFIYFLFYDYRMMYLILLRFVFLYYSNTFFHNFDF